MTCASFFFFFFAGYNNHWENGAFLKWNVSLFKSYNNNGHMKDIAVGYGKYRRSPANNADIKAGFWG